MFSSTGRLMSRTMAKKTLEQDKFKESMQGIVYDSDVPELIDEAPMAYKNLDTVMKDQDVLVEVVHRLFPLINVKGFEAEQVNGKRKIKKMQQQQPEK